MEQVLVLIKPEGLQKAIVGDVFSQFVSSDLKLAGLKLVKASDQLAKAHYALLKDKFFYWQIVEYLTGKFHDGLPVVAMVFEGRGAIAKCRRIAGATNPEEAGPKSVRGKYGRITTKGLFENVVHVSSSTDEARREIALWFRKSELLQ
ncbi:MAG: nucleoside-diphosphate kinase [Candidatus Omnitrophica bacterium]|nr:nucleoside-diphosphate kinase [Candidatus Omnitrophota bacterium]